MKRRRRRRGGETSRRSDRHDTMTFLAGAKVADAEAVEAYLKMSHITVDMLGVPGQQPARAAAGAAGGGMQQWRNGPNAVDCDSSCGSSVLTSTMDLPVYSNTSRSSSVLKRQRSSSHSRGSSVSLPEALRGESGSSGSMCGVGGEPSTKEFGLMQISTVSGARSSGNINVGDEEFVRECKKLRQDSKPHYDSAYGSLGQVPITKQESVARQEEANRLARQISVVSSSRQVSSDEEDEGTAEPLDASDFFLGVSSSEPSAVTDYQAQADAAFTAAALNVDPLDTTNLFSFTQLYGDYDSASAGGGASVADSVGSPSALGSVPYSWGASASAGVAAAEVSSADAARTPAAATATAALTGEAPELVEAMVYGRVIAEEMPAGWECRTAPGGEYYVNKVEQITTMLDPRVELGPLGKRIMAEQDELERQARVEESRVASGAVASEDAYEALMDQLSGLMERMLVEQDNVREQFRLERMRSQELAAAQQAAEQEQQRRQQEATQSQTRLRTPPVKSAVSARLPPHPPSVPRPMRVPRHRSSSFSYASDAAGVAGVGAASSAVAGGRRTRPMSSNGGSGGGVSGGGGGGGGGGAGARSLGRSVSLGPKVERVVTAGGVAGAQRPQSTGSTRRGRSNSQIAFV